MYIMDFQPIIRTGREDNVNQLWIEHATTNIRDGGGEGCHVIVSGTVAIQSLRRCKHRLVIREFNIRSVTGSALPPEQLSKLHIYVIPMKTTKVIDAINDQDDKRGMYVACVSDYMATSTGAIETLKVEEEGIHHSGDKSGTQVHVDVARTNDDRNKGADFHIPVSEYICKVHVTKAFAIAIVLMHQNMPMAVIASGDLKPSTISFHPRALNSMR